MDYTDEIGGHFVGSRGGFVAVYPGFDGLADDFGSGEILAVSQAGDALAGFWIETKSQWGSHGISSTQE